jgi:hypothetical protein
MKTSEVSSMAKQSPATGSLPVYGVVDSRSRRENPPNLPGSELTPSCAFPRIAENGPRPPLRRGLSITDYSQTQLVRLAHWIESDDRLRTEDELLDGVMRELGFQKRGSRIVRDHPGDTSSKAIGRCRIATSR